MVFTVLDNMNAGGICGGLMRHPQANGTDGVM